VACSSSDAGTGTTNLDEGGADAGDAGVLYKGSKPTLDATTTTTGDSGAKGTGGVPTANDGVDGQKTDALQL
jgi:hypothetical protein